MSRGLPSRARGLGFVVPACLAVLALAPAQASAATLVVTTTSDEVSSGDGLCSLREAIASVDSPGSPSSDCAQPDATNNTIVLDSGTYSLSIPGAGTDNSSGDLGISGSVAGLHLTGAGSASTTID